MQLQCFFFFFFLVSQETWQQQNPNLKIRFSTSCAYDSQWATKRAKFFPRGKPPLYGVNLKKSPIKNHTILFRSGRVVKSNPTKLGSIKPNKREYTKFSYLKQIHWVKCYNKFRNLKYHWRILQWFQLD